MNSNQSNLSSNNTDARIAALRPGYELLSGDE